MSLKREILTSEQKFQRRVEVVRIALSQGPQLALIRSGIPIRTIHSWVSRFKSDGIEGLKDLSRAPKLVANKKDQDGVLSKALVELHEKEPGLTRLQIFGKLFLEPSKDLPTLAWIDRATKRLGLTHQRKKRREEHKLRYEIPVPGFLQIDTKFVDKEDAPGKKLYQFTAIDECSRVRFLASSSDKSAPSAVLFLENAITFFRSLGVTIVQAQTDHGTEFTLPRNEVTFAAFARGETDDALFTQTCHHHGIRHKLIRPRTPQLNGKVERSHRIDGERFYSRFKFSSQETHEHALKHIWMPEYNEVRPHGALSGMAPMDFLKKRMKEIEDQANVELLNNPASLSEEQKAA